MDTYTYKAVPRGFTLMLHWHHATPNSLGTFCLYHCCLAGFLSGWGRRSRPCISTRL